MAPITNTLQTHQLKGLRENLTDAIYRISPEDTPISSNIGRSDADAVLHEWQVDTLASPDTSNAQVEGFDNDSFAATPVTTRIGNYTQISKKDVIISETSEAVKKAGRGSEMGYQMAKRSVELRIDVEAILVANQGASGGSSSTARTAGSWLAFLKTNIEKASDGVNPVWTTVPTDVRTDGTPEAFVEADLQSVMQQCYNSGGKPKLVFTGAFNKVVASGFDGILVNTNNQSGPKPAVIVAAADVYVSDFGTVTIMPTHFQRASDVLVIDPAMASIAFLRGYATKDLAVTGDAKKKLITVEYTLKVNNEAAHGGIFDRTSS